MSSERTKRNCPYIIKTGKHKGMICKIAHTICNNVYHRNRAYQEREEQFIIDNPNAFKPLSLPNKKSWVIVNASAEIETTQSARTNPRTTQRDSTEEISVE